jgi:uncharacterized surface protein with fasciclin (FAS1) repeats
VRSDRFAEFENGAQLIVRGRLQLADPPPHLPRGHLAQIRLGLLRKRFEIEASQIEVYDRLKDGTLLDLADKLETPSYRTFAKALRATGWDKTLRQPSYFTVLAPTEYAFNRLPEAERRALFAPENANGLESLVRRHIVAGWKAKSDLMSQPFLETLGRDAIPIEVTDGKLRIGGARVLFQDQSARNGVVLSLDRLLPVEPRHTNRPPERRGSVKRGLTNLRAALPRERLEHRRERQQEPQQDEDNADGAYASEVDLLVTPHLREDDPAHQPDHDADESLSAQRPDARDEIQRLGDP